MQKVFTRGLALLSLVFLASCAQPTDELVKIYTNDTNGYEIQYPSFLTLDDSKSDDVSFTNNTCKSNDKLCIKGVDVEVYVEENNEKMTIDQKFNEYIENNKTCKQIKIFPLPEKFDENELINAVRCEFDEVPKQAKGGYTYTIINEAKIFSIIIYKGDSTILGFVDGSLLNIAKDSYDPLGDMMMRTFKFTK